MLSYLRWSGGHSLWPLRVLKTPTVTATLIPAKSVESAPDKTVRPFSGLPMKRQRTECCVAVNGFIESLGVVLQMMEELDVDVLEP